MNYTSKIKFSQISYKLLVKGPLEEQKYWIKRISERHIHKRKVKRHIDWLKGLVQKLEINASNNGKEKQI
ncbi:MAG: hypothetical protein MRERC_14c004 [Mycoplasmataceae bacterium RC_NB112A]|nr:MAG: hypothetical protein MRERC_14c004 [Mycoplasmataceae bacterium RC_NB112A]